jgi:hypothetical protein
VQVPHQRLEKLELYPVSMSQHYLSMQASFQVQRHGLLHRRQQAQVGLERQPLDFAQIL